MFIKEEVKKVDRNRVFTPFCDLKYLNGCMGESRKHKFDDSNNLIKVQSKLNEIDILYLMALHCNL